MRTTARVSHRGESDDDRNYSIGKKNIFGGTRSLYLPSGAGRHRCIGEMVAYLNFDIIVATMLHHHHFHTIDDSCTVPSTDFAFLFSRPVQPAVVRWGRRDAKGSEKWMRMSFPSLSKE
ncbi:sterol 14alpha-demethylase [Geosmithia morbida]|uniref:Sterol 14alpha-demethylase n=1 Tax=Geosmithia morbida TaxID=1094350 RepID=A0A9P4YUL4_9HYPO|nr:sterol 14alpha-demethylase [Geosmithia morbida]KAF4122350.1 sterol 14alpha-demethylase [Geosmithia morbida]